MAKKYWLAALVCVALLLSLLVNVNAKAVEGSTWDTDIDAMNRQIDETNFVLGNWCSTTLFDAKRRLLVTAQHCVDNNVNVEHYRVELPNGQFILKTREVWTPFTVSQNNYDVDNKLIRHRTLRAELRGYDAVHDVAILQIDDTPQATFAFAAPLSHRPAVRGEAAWAVGNPLIIEAVVSRGIIGSLTFQLPRQGFPTIRAIVFMFPIRPGSSGGALYNKHGEIIGLTNWADQGGSLALASPVENVFALLDKIFNAKVASK